MNCAFLFLGVKVFNQFFCFGNNVPLFQFLFGKIISLKKNILSETSSNLTPLQQGETGKFSPHHKDGITEIFQKKLKYRSSFTKGAKCYLVICLFEHREVIT